MITLVQRSTGVLSEWRILRLIPLLNHTSALLQAPKVMDRLLMQVKHLKVAHHLPVQVKALQLVRSAQVLALELPDVCVVKIHRTTRTQMNGPCGHLKNQLMMDQPTFVSPLLGLMVNPLVLVRTLTT